ncbi:MAG: hypothetical protein HQM08_19680 [Candidatus Riflebacteria bacterium]|nr:hypothetical protein [Candidatus Riflebacteria bacterium]
MMRLYHRGAYENLWHEHKFAVLAISHKKFITGAKKIGCNPPRILSFLDFLAKCQNKDRSEQYSALLTVYHEIKDFLDRGQKRKIVEKIVDSDNSVFDDLFEKIIFFKFEKLFGCRLFYPNSPIFKFWDFNDTGGLSVMLGPVMFQLSKENVKFRLCEATGLYEENVDQFLNILRPGIPKSEFNEFPKLLSEALEKNLLLAKTLNQVFLHPRIASSLNSTEKPECCNSLAALYAIEQYWDQNCQEIPLLPADEDWHKEIGTAENSNIAEITKLFNEQLLMEGKFPELESESELEPELESGLKSESETEE